MSYPTPPAGRLTAELLRPSLVQGLLLMLACCVVGGAYFLPSWTAQGEPLRRSTTVASPLETLDPELRARLDLAHQHFLAQDWAETARAYRAIVTDHPELGVAWHRLAYALHVQGKIEEAIPCHEQAARFGNLKAVSLYNLACAYALKKDKATALTYLRQAIDVGFNGLEYLENDTDLNFLRQDPAFEKMREEVRQRGGHVRNSCPDCAQASPEAEYRPLN